MAFNEENFTVVDWFKKILIKNYGNFSGRARRKEFWYFNLGLLIVLFPLIALMFYALSVELISLFIVAYLVIILILLATFIPGLSVSIRRLHDINKSGWFYLVFLVPLVGSFILLIWFLMEGTPGSNHYGPDPKRGRMRFDFENLHFTELPGEAQNH